MNKKREIKFEYNVPLQMRDGTILRADVYRPADEKRYPALLLRSPYLKKNMKRYLDPNRMALAGYGVVIQDCRGTGESDGHFEPFIHEFEDGYDTVEQVARLPWCDGQVGMYGISYFGFTQLAAASMQPPSLKTICPGQVAARWLPPCRNGIWSLQANLAWYLNQALNAVMRSKMTEEKKRGLLNQIGQSMDHLEEQLWFLPLKDVPAAHIEDVPLSPFYLEQLKHVADEEYWRNKGVPIPFHKIAIPALHLSGWYDFMLDGVLDNYVGLRNGAATSLARENQKLIIGPWAHGSEMLSTVGELDFGLSSSGNAIDVTGIHLRWFDYWLKGKNNGIMQEPPVRLFVTGENRWRDENEWPLSRAKLTKYYLHSDGQANRRLESGFLNQNRPEEECADHFLYDPKHPLPSTLRVPPTARYAGLLQDHQELEQREDVLVYTSNVLHKDLEVTGPIEVRLWISSSVPDTDFMAKLLDVWPDGRVYNLTDGMTRVRFRESLSAPKLLNPGEVVELKLDLGAVAHVFKAGHRIRLHISSSHFPRYDRNLNTGHPIGEDGEMKVAFQSVYHDREHPSHLLLPIIPR